MDENEIYGICCLLLIIIAVGAWLWEYHRALTIISVIVFVAIIFYIGYRRAKAERESKRLEEEQIRKREQFEREQLAKGNIRFVDKYGYERWGTPAQVNEWEREEEERERTVFFREKTVIKEVVKIRCPYCRSLYDQSHDRCPYCGGTG
jgi:hypothetical protein